MDKVAELFRRLVVENLQSVYALGAEHFPKILTSILILLVGWVSALLVKKIAIKILRALGSDVISEKTGLERYLEKGLIRKKPSHLIGAGFYWLIIFASVVMVFNTWGLVQVSGFMKGVVSYIPKLIVAIVLISLGHFLGHFLQAFVMSSSALARIPFASSIGKIARYSVVIIAVMMALEQLGIARTIVTTGFAIFAGVILLFAVLILSFGLKDVVSDVIAGRILQREFKSGDEIDVDGRIGKIESFELTQVRLKTDRGTILIPNAVISRKIVERLEKTEG